MTFSGESRARRLARFASVAAMVVCTAMLLESCDYRTRRDFGPARSLAGPYEVDGFEQWAGVAALFGIAALVLLWAIVARLSRDRGGGRDSLRITTVFACLAATCFAIGAGVAGRYWQSMVAERDAADYAIRIAPGLPAVTLAGVIGVALCAIILVFLSYEQWTNGRIEESSDPDASSKH